MHIVEADALCHRLVNSIRPPKCSGTLHKSVYIVQEEDFSSEAAQLSLQL